MSPQSGGDMRALGLTVRSADYLTHWTVRIIRLWTQMTNTLRCMGRIVSLIDGELINPMMSFFDNRLGISRLLNGVSQATTNGWV